MRAQAKDQSALLKAPAGPRRQPAALPLSPLPDFVDAAAAQTRNAHQPFQQGPPSALGVSSEPGDLVARALAILKDARKKNHLLFFDDFLGLYVAGVTSQSENLKGTLASLTLPSTG